MRKTIRNLTGVLLVAAAALAAARSQNAAQELHLSNIKAQQPQETIFASAPCQRARESPRGMTGQRSGIDPRMLAPDLNTLMEKSDEVILAGDLDHGALLSPSGEGVTTYYDVRVIRSWNGSHRVGDVLTFGVPDGLIHCKPLDPDNSWFWSSPAGGWGFPSHGGPWLYLLFLRQSSGNETKSVQGLRLTAGEGVQGMFLIPVPAPTPFEEERYCAGVITGSVEHCDSYVETSSGPVMLPYLRDPLAKKYRGMPVRDFLREVRSVAAAQGLAEKSSSK